MVGIYTPSRVYPHFGGDRLVAAELDRDLEHNPGPLPPTNPNPELGVGGMGAGQFKYWVDTTDPLLPALRQCIATRASAGVYVPAEWLTIGTFDLAAAKFTFNGDQVNFGGVLTIPNMNVDTLGVDVLLSVAGTTELQATNIFGFLSAGADVFIAGKLDLTGPLNVTGLITANGGITTPGGITTASLNVTGGATIAVLNATTSVSTADIYLDGWIFADGNGTSTVNIYAPGDSGTARLSLNAPTSDPYTNVTNLYTNATHTFRNIGGGATFATIDNTGIYAPVAVNTALFKLSNIAFANDAGAQRIIYDNVGVANITLYNTGDNYYHNNRHNFQSRGGGAVTFAQFDATGSYNPSGSWTAISGADLKEFVAPYRRGLDAIMQLQPVEFAYKAGVFSEAGDDHAAHVGLIAEDVQPVVPEMCGNTEITLDDKLTSVGTIRPTHLVWILVNAVKELAERVAALEPQAKEERDNADRRRS